jgi:galactose-1-phosphate uridylyltransferase
MSEFRQDPVTGRWVIIASGRASRWHMEILPQNTRAAGFEWGTGVHMNSTAPEDAARSLRDARV